MLIFFVKNLVCFLLLLSATTFIGCSHHASVKADYDLTGSALDHIRIFQKEKLAKGGNLLVVPFSAGENVESSDELDRVSLTIVKGIADVLADKDQPFKLMVQDDVQKTGFVIKGRITRIEQKNSSIKPWQAKKRKFSLYVEGMILEVDSEEVLAKFSLVKTTQEQKNWFEGLGYAMGEEIGRFLLTTVSK
ncbi:MAG: hypothetical protein H6753_04910 [Candidatus Omnitrophica bacterium]|nr:hypothetical protein [Candidatus Omnitrophota bacterium]